MGFKENLHTSRCSGSIFFKRLAQTDYYTGKVNVLSQFRKKMCFLKEGRLFLPFLVVVGLQKPFYIALAVDYFAFYLNVRDNARISPFLQRADAYFQIVGCFPVA